MIDGRVPALNGYLNICQGPATTNDQERVYAELQNIDNMVDHNECTDVLALDVIDYLPLGLRHNVINHWCTKVAHGGTITLSGLNLQEVTRLIFNGKISDVAEINRIVYGNISNVWTIRKSFTPPEDTAGMIMSTGQFDIVAQRFDGVFYVITAKRK